LDTLPDDLPGQVRLLRSLVDWCRDDGDVRWLVIGCSLARARADWMSDLDVAMGVTDGQVEGVVRRFVGSAGGFGDLVECLDHWLAAVDRPHRRVFAQYADRTQIDLVIVDTSNSNLPGTVVLYDPDGLVTARTIPAAPSDVAWTWACLAWEALANLGKYLRRRSPWEAHDRLETARKHFWQLWALTDGVPGPEYGITSVLDAEGTPSLPVGIERTLAGLDLAEIWGAASCLAVLLTDLQDLPKARGARVPEAFGRFVTEDLEAFRACTE